MSRREDHHTHTVADAADEARRLGEAYDTDPREYDRPTKAELDAAGRAPALLGEDPWGLPALAPTTTTADFGEPPF